MIPILQYMVPKLPYIEPDVLIWNRIISILFHFYNLWNHLINVWNQSSRLHFMIAIFIIWNQNSLFLSQQVKGRGHWVLLLQSIHFFMKSIIWLVIFKLCILTLTCPTGHAHFWSKVKVEMNLFFLICIC
jgi:hypothetical protein